MNEEQLSKIKADLAEQGITVYNTHRGNNCIIVTYGRVECYYHFDSDNEITSVIFD
jgi:hypothetical protein